MSACLAAAAKSCSTWNWRDFASTAYASSRLATMILSFGIPASRRFWACAAPWLPKLDVGEIEYIKWGRWIIPEEDDGLVLEEAEVGVSVVVAVNG